MPATFWSDIIGYTCIYCGKWATHWYADIPICCSCHMGETDSFMESRAIELNTLFQKGLPLEIEDNFPQFTLDGSATPLSE